MKFIVCRWSAAFLLFAALGTALAQAIERLPAGVTRGPTVEGITEYRLANGLRVILFADPSKPTATVNITYLVGSRHENYGETGMAHLLEHLIFKGSKNFQKPDVEFTRRGFQNNGSTWLDRTNYFSTFQASDDNLKWAIDWSADAMVNSFISKKDLDSEMTVVRNEYESGENNPTQVMLKRMQAMLFDWHNYGNSTIGARSDIENVRIENLQAFYRMYYQPDNAVLTVSGRFDERQTLQWIAQAFGKIPKPKRTLPPLWTIEPTHDGDRTFTVRRPGEIQLVVAGYRLPSALHADLLAADVAADVLGDTPNGRLHEALVASGKAAQVFSFTVAGRDPGFVLFGAVVKKGEPLEPVRQTMVDVIEGFGKTPVTDAEVKRQVQKQNTQYDRALADPQAFGIGLSEYISLGDWRLFFYTRDQLSKLTPASVGHAASKYFTRDNRVVGMFIPDDAPQRAAIPIAPSPAQVLAEYKPSEKGSVGEVFNPTQENIDKRTRLLSFGDLNVALLPKQNRGNTVNVHTNFQWGSPESLNGRMVEAELAAAMLGRGTDKLTRQQIADEMTRLQMTGGLTTFQTTRANLPDALRLLASVMRSPSFPASEYEQLQRQIVTGLAAQLDNPDTISRDALSSHFNTYPPGDPRHYIPLRREDRYGAPRRRSMQRAGFTATFTEPRAAKSLSSATSTPKQIEALVNELFTDYKSKAPYARLDREYREVKPARLTVDTPEKENAFIRARIDFPLRDDDPDAPALMLADEIFGGGAGMSNRVIERLRQKDGISYGAGTGLMLGSRYKLSTWSLGALTAPQNAIKAEQAIREEIERARRDGFTAKELEDAKKGTLQERATNRAQDNVLANAWTANMDLGRTFAFSKQFEDRLRAVTVDQVNAAFRKYIDPARMTFVIAGDAKKGAK